MNQIVNTFLLTSDKFMSKIHFIQPRFIYIRWGPFAETIEKVKNINEW